MAASSPPGRPEAPAAGLLLGAKKSVLSHGYVVLVDYMGNDAAIVQAARVSYGQGTKSVRDDRGLIRYLMRHRHTTPFEMVELKFLVRLPIYVARQWIRHRTACLVGSTRLSFDRPSSVRTGRRRHVSLTVQELWERFQPDRVRSGASGRLRFDRSDRAKQLALRQLDEETLAFRHTRLVDVTESGWRPVFRMTLDDGKQIECTADHRFRFEDGWHTLAEGTGLKTQRGQAVWDGGDHRISVNGWTVGAPAPYHDREWLRKELGFRRRSTGDLARACGASADTIERWARRFGLPEAGDGEAAPVPSAVGDPEVPTWTRTPEAVGRSLTIAKSVRIARFEYLGHRMTYDVEVEGPFHNFVANGIVTHNSVNEHSARYSIIPDEFDLPALGDIRRQSEVNRQGRGEALPPEVAERFRSDLDRISQEAYASYRHALEAGVARETARLVLPLSYYTEWYWKIDLWNLFHFLSLRLDPHAQEEIRRYAAVVAEAARAVCPVAYEAFEEFVLEGVSLSRRERVAIRALLEGVDVQAACARAGLPLTREDGSPRKTGEGVEFLAKLERIRASTASGALE